MDKLNISVLFVEDEPDQKEVISDILTQMVSRLWTAGNGREGLALYQSQQPDLIITDIEMPEMNGLEMIRRMRRLNPQIKIIVISAHEETDYFIDAIEVGVNGFLLKPVKYDRLTQVLTELANTILLEKRLSIEETERRKVEKELKESEQRYYWATDAGQVGVWDWNLETDELLVYPKLLTVLGLTENKISHHIEDWFNVLSSHERDNLMKSVSSHLRGSSPEIELEQRIVMADESVHWLLIRGHAVLDRNKRPVRIVGTGTDITRLHNSEEALRHERNLFVQGPVVILKWRRIADQFLLEYVSPNVQTILGFTGDSILGDATKYFSKIVPEDFEKIGHRENYFRNDGSESYEHPPYRLYRSDGGVIWVKEYMTVVRDSSGMIENYLGYIFDITDQKRVEEELKVARDAAERAALAQSEFLANMSHEIRTPMNTVLGFTDLLSNMIDDPKQRSYLETIKASGKSLLTLINDILDLSRIEAGKMVLQYEPINLSGFYKDIEQIFFFRVQEKDLEFIIDIDPNLPEYLLLDEVRLRQILFNLVGNAVKFTEQGSITIQTRSRYIDPERKKIDLSISVHDTGIGIPLVSQEEIFEAFKQKDGQSTKKYPGTGLGLTITKRLVQMMNGTISLTSQVNRGSTFEVVLHNVSVSESPAAYKEKPRGDVELSFKPSTTVLIVDDIDSNRTLVSEYFQEKGIRVLEAANGQEAIEVTRKFMPDVLFMDIKMPVMNGEEANRILKSDPSTRGIPVIAMTASVMKQDVERIMAAGFDSHLRKPVQRNDLYRELANYITHEEKALADEEPQQDGSDKDINLNIPRKILFEIVTILEENLAEEWRNASESGDVDDIMDFAGKVDEVGMKHDIPIISEYAGSLRDMVNHFDIANLNKQLKRFPGIINLLRDQAEHSGDAQ